jgi:hypothetical protein
MKPIIKSLLFLPILLFSFSCSDKVSEEQIGFTIQYGSECGWCAGQEYISINSLKVEYERNIPCGDDEGTTKKSRNLSSKEWDTITSSFDYSLYKTLQYNNCNVCADGCDEIIQITEDEFTHELRYSFSDEVEGMENLRKILAEIMDEMRELD